MNREAKILRDRRKELDISQQALATEVGLEVRQYQRFEYGQQLISHANMKLGLRICAALELDPFELVFEDGVDVAVPKKQNCCIGSFLCTKNFIFRLPHRCRCEAMKTMAS